MSDLIALADAHCIPRKGSEHKLTEARVRELLPDVPGWELVEDGHALMRKVRALPPEHNGDIPAVALTAYARAEDRVTAIRAGFQMHAAKPVEPNELLAMVATLVRKRTVAA